MNVAFVFPGQGSQYVGMGKDLYEGYEEVRDIYETASRAVGYDIADVSFNGPKEELNRTARTQPCLLTASYAAYRVLVSEGITPRFVAGHSLGEYSAVAAAGVIPFADAVSITEKRGALMQEAVPEGKGLMAAIIGVDRQAIEKICASVASGRVSPANYNCPGQTVIAGDKAAVEEAMKHAEDIGAKRALPLAVSVPSHCMLMEKASKQLARLLEGTGLHHARIPVVNNADAKVIETPEDIWDSLVRQLHSPLLWEDSIRGMINHGVNTFVEVGPGRVLSGLIKRIDNSVALLNAEDNKSLQKTLHALSS